MYDCHGFWKGTRGSSGPLSKRKSVTLRRWRASAGEPIESCGWRLAPPATRIDATCRLGLMYVHARFVRAGSEAQPSHWESNVRSLVQYQISVG
jgi:hypothetical protein